MRDIAPAATQARLRRILPWLVLAVAVVLADQATKLLVLAKFAPGESLPVTFFFDLVLVYNKGAAFSFLAQADGWQTPLLIGISFNVADSAITVGAVILIVDSFTAKEPAKEHA